MKPIIGVGIIIDNNGMVPLGLRKDNNTWSLPGGKMKEYETIFECARRELKEETGLDSQSIPEIISVSNIISKEYLLHSLTLGIYIKSFSGLLSNIENKNFFNWKWVSLCKLPENLFLPSIYVIQAYFKYNKKYQNYKISDSFQLFYKSIFYIEGEN